VYDKDIIFVLKIRTTLDEFIKKITRKQRCGDRMDVQNGIVCDCETG